MFRCSVCVDNKRKPVSGKKLETGGLVDVERLLVEVFLHLMNCAAALERRRLRRLGFPATSAPARF